MKKIDLMRIKFKEEKKKTYQKKENEVKECKKKSPAECAKEGE